MAMGTSPSKRRDRHGRGMRRPVHSKLFRFGMSGGSYFEQVVADTCDYLKESFPEELGNLSFRIEEVPPISSEVGEVVRYSVNRQNFQITLYRIPIQRMNRVKYLDPQMQIERAVFDAAAELVDKDPWDLIHPHSH